MALRITLGDLLHDCSKKYTDRPFLTIAESGETLSYKEFETLTNRLAHGLTGRFRDQLAYVSILLENSKEYLALTYALKKINSVEVSISRSMRGVPLARMIDQTEAKILITSGAHLEPLKLIRENIPHVRTLIMLDAMEEARSAFPELDIVSISDVLSDCIDHIVSPAKDTDTATILFTSGTTGVSKGCMLSHRYAVRTAENMIQPFRLTPEDCAYAPYPLSHISALRARNSRH